MAEQIELWQIGDKRYVTTQAAALYLGVAITKIPIYALARKIQRELFEGRPMVEWDSLQSFAEFRNQFPDRRSRRRKSITLNVVDSSREVRPVDHDG